MTATALPAPAFTVAYTDATGPHRQPCWTPGAVEVLGRSLLRAADRGEAWDIAVHDAAGAEVTFGFAFTA